MIAEAEVTTTPTNANRVIEGGRPIACPLICAFWLFEYLVKSGIFNESVAQKPTTAVNAGKKNLKKEELSANFEGSLKIGPNPFAATTAQQNKAIAAIGKKIALKTSSFRILSTPLYMINILSSQKRPKHTNGNACGKRELVSISSNEGFHALIK